MVRWNEQLGGTYLNQLSSRCRRWNRVSVLLQPFDVKLDGFPDQVQDLLASLARRNAPR